MVEGDSSSSSKIWTLRRLEGSGGLLCGRGRCLMSCVFRTSALHCDARILIFRYSRMYWVWLLGLLGSIVSFNLIWDKMGAMSRSVLGPKLRILGWCVCWTLVFGYEEVVASGDQHLFSWEEWFALIPELTTGRIETIIPVRITGGWVGIRGVRGPSSSRR